MSIRSTWLVPVVTLFLTAISPAWSQAATTVKVQATEWLQPADFSSFSWAEVETVCNAENGLCSGELEGRDLTGWTWASSADVATLFNSFIGRIAFGAQYTPGRQTAFDKDKTWAPEFFAVGFKPHGAADGEYHLSAYVRDEVSAGGGQRFKIIAGISAYPLSYCAPVCNSAEINASWDYFTQGAPPQLGYWFYREPANTLR